jgi:hypothetical protein
MFDKCYRAPTMTMSSSNKPVVVNPYAKKKNTEANHGSHGPLIVQQKQLKQSTIAAAAGVGVPKSMNNSNKEEKILPSAPRVVVPKSTKAAKIAVPSAAPPTAPRAATAGKSVVAASASTACTSKSSSMSLKAKLKKEIADLKRAKTMEQQRKKEEKRQKLLHIQQQVEQEEAQGRRLVQKGIEEQQRKEQEIMLLNKKRRDEEEVAKIAAAAAAVVTVQQPLPDSKQVVVASLPTVPPQVQEQPSLPLPPRPVFPSATPYGHREQRPSKTAAHAAAATTPFFNVSNQQLLPRHDVTPSPYGPLVHLTQQPQAHASTTAAAVAKIVPPTPVVHGGVAPAQPKTTTTSAAIQVVPPPATNGGASAETAQSSTNTAATHATTSAASSNSTIMPPTPAATPQMTTPSVPPPHSNPGIVSYPQSYSYWNNPAAYMPPPPHPNPAVVLSNPQSYSYWNQPPPQQQQQPPGHPDNYQQHYYAYGSAAHHPPAPSHLQQNHQHPWYGPYYHAQHPHLGAPPPYPHQHYYAPPPFYGGSHSYSQQQQHQHPRGPAPSTLSTTKPAATSKMNYKASNNQMWYSQLFSADIMKPPSPFATTHVLLADPITIIKKPGEVFGVSLGTDRQSVLVEPEWLENYVKQMSDQLYGGKNNNNDSESGTEKQDSSIATRRETVADDEAIISNDGAPTASNAPTTKRRRPRRRFFFSAMSIIDAKAQNQRLTAAAATTQANNDHGAISAPQLQQRQLLVEGDILIAINGQPVAGKTFVEACALFNNNNSKDVESKDGFVRCHVTVARKQVVQQPTKTWRPTTIQTSTHVTTVKTPQQQLPEGLLVAPVVTEADMTAFARALCMACTDPAHVLGKPVLSEYVLLPSCIQLEPALSGKSLVALVTAWKKVEQEMNVRMMARAGQQSKKEWQNLPFPHFTEAQLHKKRYALKPLKGCKCGSQDHEYVNDPNCPLYRNLLRLDDDGTDDNADDAHATKNGKLAKKKITQLQRDLKPVQSAFVKRIMRETGEKNAEQAEARFVERMEEIQLRKCNKAIFAPSLTAAVLSAVVELESKGGGTGGSNSITLVSTLGDSENTRFNGTSNSHADWNCESHDSDDDDDDVPLAALGKRSVQSTDHQSSKKQKGHVRAISNQNLASVVRFISQRWGHVMKEPSAMDYAWRWELFHGQTTGAEGNKFWSNPCGPGSLSLENTHLLLDDKLVASVIKPFPTAAMGERDEALKTIAFVLQTSSAGIVDEALALVRMGVLEINDHGILQLASEWYANVDILLLSDMAENWGILVDPEGRYGVNDEIRDVLWKEWIQNKDGSWAYRSDPDDTVYVSSDFAMWREAFEHKHENRSAGNEGIGRFGL